MEIRVDIAPIDVRSFFQLVIGASRNPPAAPVVSVFADIYGIENSNRLPADRRQVRHRLNVVNPAPIPIVRATNEQTETLVRTKPPANGTGRFHKAAAAENGSISTHAAHLHRGTLPGGLGDQVYGAANAIAIHVGLQRLVNFN